MDTTILTPSEITIFNQKNIAADPTLYDVNAIPDTLSRDELVTKIRSISRVSKYERIYEDGTPVTKADWARYESMLNLAGIRKENPVRFALAIKRTAMRTYPTHDLLFSAGAQDRDIERFQESALFPGDAVAVLHQSRDKKWALVQSYNYIAWVPMTSIAIGKKKSVFAYKEAKDFLLVTGDKIRTVYNPVEPRVSELQLDMGVKLPLSRPENLAHNLYGQNPYLSHMVKLPVRNEDGSLGFKHALIQRKEDVHVGYLPMTHANIIRQSFKFLGERYGWGHRFNGRDCTGFVSEIYKSFGIKLPRNSGDQGKSEIGINTRYGEDSPLLDKIKRLKTGKPGDLIYIPGHVLMLIGQSDGEPFVIHDVHGLGYLNKDGSFYKGTLNGVSITPVIPLRTNAKTTYLDRAYTIKTVK
ncbi:MAG TPA: hypothetical protein ENJ42_05440 [Hellea balneolensis]|uniref:NlpC/P60 domain-containing protein n=1 Tax=Hellea balneolensis TaxID=287478 RepID=A0A7C5QPI5_9PROT|nr:hypothetical protein [Hellea balneolensis]